MKTFYARCCSTCKNGIFFLLRAAQLLFARKKVLHFAGKTGMLPVWIDKHRKMCYDKAKEQNYVTKGW